MSNVRIVRGAKLYIGSRLLGIACSISFPPIGKPVFSFNRGCKCGNLVLRERHGKRRRSRGGNLICFNCGRVVK